MSTKILSATGPVLRRTVVRSQASSPSGPRLPWKSNHKVYKLSRPKLSGLLVEDNATEVALGGLMDGSDGKLREFLNEGLCEQAEELLEWELSQCADPFTRKKLLQVILRAKQRLHVDQPHQLHGFSGLKDNKMQPSCCLVH